LCVAISAQLDAANRRFKLPKRGQPFIRGLIPVPETPSAFHPHAQRSVDPRDARQQSRSFAHWNQSPDDPVADESRACHFDSNRHSNTNTNTNSHVHAIANRDGYIDSKSTARRVGAKQKAATRRSVTTDC